MKHSLAAVAVALASVSFSPAQDAYPAGVTKEMHDAAQRGLEWLARNQANDGSWRNSGGYGSYPAAMTGGCTAESCHFRDLAAEFAEVGAQRVGISTDSVQKQLQFSDTYGFDYPLLSDSEGQVARQFGVKRGWGPLPVKRHTFVIDTDSSIAEVIASEWRMNVHADKALETLRALKSTRH